MQIKFNKGNGAGGVPFGKTVCSHLWSVLLFANIFILLSFLLTGLFREQSTVLGIRPMWIASDSMEPLLEVGDWVIGIPVSTEEIQVGEVLAYRQDNTSAIIHPVIIHRLVEITEEGQYLFKGDNNSYIDEPVSSGQILYRIVRPPKLKYKTGRIKR